MCTLECKTCYPGCGAKFFNAFDSIPQGRGVSVGGIKQRRELVFETRRDILDLRAGHQLGTGGPLPPIGQSGSTLNNGFQTDGANLNEDLAVSQAEIEKLKEEMGRRG